MRFIRKNGRIIPIKEKEAAEKDSIAKLRKRQQTRAKIAGGIAGGGAGLAVVGSMHNTIGNVAAKSFGQKAWAGGKTGTVAEQTIFSNKAFKAAVLAKQGAKQKAIGLGIFGLGLGYGAISALRGKRELKRIKAERNK